MTKENVRQFYNHLASDIALQERFKEMNARLVEGFNGKRPDDKQMDELFRNELLPVAKEAGFEFSLDDLKAYSSEAKTTGELADEELATVVGGGDCCVCVIAGFGVIGGFTMSCALWGGMHSRNMYCLCVFGGGGGLR